LKHGKRGHQSVIERYGGIVGTMIGDLLKTIPQQFDQGIGVQLFSHGSFRFGGKPPVGNGTIDFFASYGDLLCK